MTYSVWNVNKWLSSSTEFSSFRKELTKLLYPVGYLHIHLYQPVHELWSLSAHFTQNLKIKHCWETSHFIIWFISDIIDVSFLPETKLLLSTRTLKSVRLASYFTCVSYDLFVLEISPQTIWSYWNTFCWCTLTESRKNEKVQKIARVFNSGYRTPLWVTESRKVHFLLWKCYLLTLYIWLGRVKEFAYRSKYPECKIFLQNEDDG